MVRIEDIERETTHREKEQEGARKQRREQEEGESRMEERRGKRKRGAGRRLKQPSELQARLFSAGTVAGAAADMLPSLLSWLTLGTQPSRSLTNHNAAIR